MNITFRRYQPGDEKVIIDLFNFVFNKQSTIEEWNWMYYNNFGFEQQIMLAFDGDNLVGQAAGVSLKFFFHGREIYGSRTQNVMVHPDYRRKGVFFELLSRLTKCSSEDGIDFVLTFPNDNSLHTFVKKLDYKHLFDMEMYKIPLQDISLDISADKKTRICNPREAVAISFRGILEEELDGFTNDRSKNFLKWRYLDPPGRDYHFLLFESEKKISGYMTFKRFSPGNSIDILDIVMEPDLNFFLSGLRAIVEFYQVQNIEIRYANLWSRDKYFYHNYVKNIAVQGEINRFHVVAKEFTKEAEGLLHEKNIYITMADSDIF